ncbi:hypothetical protein PspLS_07608 [Pyricularia sp. CBS 133598]|nr:hypothetical protein PspLS_07608 [Pyricularia sp. CBS 133598]
MATWSGRTAIKGGSDTMRMVLLTCNAVGVTFTWGVEMTYCTPYLLSLGLTKGQTSLVWIAGPLSGLIVQPVIGVISDTWTSKWGRRRPFIMICSVIVAVSLITLGFTRDIVSFFIPSSAAAAAAAAEVPAVTRRDHPENGFTGFLTIALAVLALYTTDFAINAVMSCARSLIVDTLPMHKQQDGAAWASRMSAIGHILGYGAGAIDLVALLGTTLGETQFKQLTLIAASGILFFSTLTCWAVSERVLVAPAPEPKGLVASGQRFKVPRQIWSTLMTLPVRIQAICWAVFWSWIGWYPFLIYSSTWVGETYFRYDVPADAKSSSDALGEMGRIGSYALTVYSIITFLGAWLIPPLVRSPEDDDEDDDGIPATSQASWSQRFLRSWFPGAARSISQLNHLKPDLLTVWTFGYIMFAFAMFMAPLASSFRFATILVALCGIPWTISMWAPTALLGVEVNRMTHGSTGQPYRRLSTSSAVELLTPVIRVNGEDTEVVAVAAAPGSAPQAAFLEDGNASRGGDGGGGELSGIYFGILNIYTTLPQFIGTFISAVVFAVLEPGKSPELSHGGGGEELPQAPSDGPNAIGICLFIGAISAVGAAYATRRLRYL